MVRAARINPLVRFDERNGSALLKDLMFSSRIPRSRPDIWRLCFQERYWGTLVLFLQGQPRHENIFTDFWEGGCSLPLDHCFFSMESTHTAARALLTLGCVVKGNTFSLKGSLVNGAAGTCVGPNPSHTSCRDQSNGQRQSNESLLGLTLLQSP